MLVGVPKEIKMQEARVGLTPAAVKEYVHHGHHVLVETAAGAGIGADDDVYRLAGATIVPDAARIFTEAELVVKVKEPQPEEWVQLRENQILYTYLHLAADREQARGLLASGVSAIAYETVTNGSGGLPLLAPMSEVAGRLSIEAAGSALRTHNGGSGLLIGGVPGVAPARVLVLGGGVVGTHSARMAAGLGAEVIIFDRSITRLRALDELFQGRVQTRFSTIAAIEEEIETADVVIGAVLIPGANAPRLISRGMLKAMRKGSVLVDVAIDQGGCFETSNPTTHAQPTYEVEGIIHYCVANMPGSVPRTSSHALNNATLPYGLALANLGLKALRMDQGLLAGLNVHRGLVTSQPVAKSLGLPFTDALEAIGR